MYGVPNTGAGASTTPSESEGNQVQEGSTSHSAEAFDEPISTAAALAFLERFVRAVA